MVAQCAALHCHWTPLGFVLIALGWLSAARLSTAQTDGSSGDGSVVVGVPDGYSCNCSQLADCSMDLVVLDTMFQEISLCVCQNASVPAVLTCSDVLAAVISNVTSGMGAITSSSSSTGLPSTPASPPDNQTVSGDTDTVIASSDTASITMTTMTGVTTSGALANQGPAEGWFGITWWYWVIIVAVAVCIVVCVVSVLITLCIVRRSERNKIVFNPTGRRGSSLPVEGKFFQMTGRGGSGGSGFGAEILRNNGLTGSELAAADTAFPLPVGNGNGRSNLYSQQSNHSMTSKGSRRSSKCTYSDNTASPVPSRVPTESNGNSGESDGGVAVRIHARASVHTYDEPSVDIPQISPTALTTFTGFSDSENSGNSEGYMYMARQPHHHGKHGGHHKTRSKSDTSDRPPIIGAEDIAESENDVIDEDPRVHHIDEVQDGEQHDQEQQDVEQEQQDVEQEQTHEQQPQPPLGKAREQTEAPETSSGPPQPTSPVHQVADAELKPKQASIKRKAPVTPAAAATSGASTQPFRLAAPPPTAPKPSPLRPTKPPVGPSKGTAPVGPVSPLGRRQTDLDMCTDPRHRPSPAVPAHGLERTQSARSATRTSLNVQRPNRHPPPAPGSTPSSLASAEQRGAAGSELATIVNDKLHTSGSGVASVPTAGNPYHTVDLFPPSAVPLGVKRSANFQHSHSG